MTRIRRSLEAMAERTPGSTCEDVRVTPSEARALFPALSRIVYLNAGTFGPLATPTIEAMQAELARDGDEGRSGMPYFLRILELREQVRAALGKLVGMPPESVALTTSTTDGCN